MRVLQESYPYIAKVQPSEGGGGEGGPCFPSQMSAAAMLPLSAPWACVPKAVTAWCLLALQPWF
jgi:hypothetical protein